MGKILFFDADGTILDIKRGLAPDVPLAIKRLVENGHMAFLCTGRSRAFVPKEVEKLPWSGMITNLGAMKRKFLCRMPDLLWRRSGVMDWCRLWRVTPICIMICRNIIRMWTGMLI